MDENIIESKKNPKLTDQIIVDNTIVFLPTATETVGNYTKRKQSIVLEQLFKLTFF